MNTETLPWEDLRICFEWASRINRDSPHRRQLRRILRDHDLEVARLLLRLHALEAEVRP